jgi:hypothetical protein
MLLSALHGSLSMLQHWCSGYVGQLLLAACCCSLLLLLLCADLRGDAVQPHHD